jgi:hypothetical protein
MSFSETKTVKSLRELKKLTDVFFEKYASYRCGVERLRDRKDFSRIGIMCVAFGSKTDPEDAYQLDAWINTEDIDLVDFFGYREHSEKDEELIRKWHEEN